MNFSAEWKSRWPISSTFSLPSLLSEKDPDSPIGPLIFTSKPDTPTSQLLHSPSLAPRLPPPYQDVSLLRVLLDFDSVPSTAAPISSFIGSLLPDHSSHFHGFNSLQLLQVPEKNLLVTIFPAGENSDRVGFTLIHVKDGSLLVDWKMNNLFQLAEEGCENRMRITRMIANPVEAGDEDVSNGDDGRNNAVGYLMVCTSFSVYWYKIGISTANIFSEYSVCMDYVGCANTTMFKGNAVASASWSPHLREECLVMLESGDLFLFDVNYSSGKRRLMSLVSVKNRIVFKRKHVSLNNKVKFEKAQSGSGGGWFDCAFSWHPEIFIASHRQGVFLIDFRSAGECSVCCLLKLEPLSVVKNDEFVSLSRAGSDGFFFTVATRSLLLLCDVRKPLGPVLRWAHGLQNPRYMAVTRLSELRANAEDRTYKLASESGHCIFLGSFWDNEFDLFCYGPNIDGNISVYVANFCNSYYSWGLPSQLSLAGHDCNCGNCLVREEFSKSSLPSWTDWRQKKQLVLGFGILDPDLFEQLSVPDNFGGFMLIKLMSSGKLEVQQFHVSWESERCLDMGRRKINKDSDDNMLYTRDDLGYDGEKKFHHLKFEFLNAYLKDELAKCVAKGRGKRKETSKYDHVKYQAQSNLNFHDEICARLKDFGLPKARSSVAVSDVLIDTNFPTSIHDIALRSIWATLPSNMLQLAFSRYSDFPEDVEKHQELLEFLDIPDQLQAPPFLFRKPSRRSNKWSNKVKPSDALVGPFLPPQFLTTFHKVRGEERKTERSISLEETEAFSYDYLFKLHCDKVMEVVEDQVSDSNKTINDDFVSLADDKDEISYGITTSKYSYHKPLAFSGNPFITSVEKPGSVNDIFSTHVFWRNQELASDVSEETAGQKLFDVGCPVELKFEERTADFGPKELVLYQNLKKWDLDFQKTFKPYQDYISGQRELK